MSNTLGDPEMKLIPLLTILFTLSTAAYYPPDRNSLQGKVVFGYQGWYKTGPYDNSWFHWFDASPSNKSFDSDFWPDTTEYPAECLASSGFNFTDGRPAKLYSNSCPGTVDTHFRWLYEYGLDCFFLQRFYTVTKQSKAATTPLVSLVMKSAEKWNRTFVIEYDLSGGGENSTFSYITQDWNYLVSNLSILNSPAYQHHNGKPVVELWGIGVRTSLSPNLTYSLVSWFQSQGCYVIQGVDKSWTYNTSGPYYPTYLLGDVIQPWMVGVYWNSIVNSYLSRSGTVGDMATIRNRNLTLQYSSVIFPGTTASNRGHAAGATINQAPFTRDNGTFFTRQAAIVSAQKPLFIFVAMFDEISEGTQVYKTIAKKKDVPTNVRLVAYDSEGGDFSNDYYLVLSNNITRNFRNVWNVPYEYQPNVTTSASATATSASATTTSASATATSVLQGEEADFVI
ncbi:hypothetical protein PROFUN_06879 [Planoprotostelium fungivorum]|uniref:Uncharacterized protein n=1 Tax=Planoprotostelium fungivorum TaxID=1890364 RepID=A0A2P6NMT3_9EUKA|nr:hypothetical protein PROFUN_06879 [Planoprotostelium fungivorum]